MKVGAKIGRPVKVDQATNLVSRGKLARMCVEVDMTKPLLAKFRLRRHIRRIEYEEITENFGPWMMVRRKSRRFEKGSDSRVCNVHDNRKLFIHKESTFHTTFNPLPELDSNEDGLVVARPMNNGVGLDDQGGMRMGSSLLVGRQMRPSVIITEKEVANVPLKSTSNKITKKAFIRPVNVVAVNEQASSSKVPNRAAAHSEHIMVRGSQGRQVIERKVVCNIPDAESDMALLMKDKDIVEHHQDPLRICPKKEAMMIVKMTDEETSSTYMFNQNKNSGFVDWIFEQGFLDLGFARPKFTWMRGTNPQTFKGAHLDRALCNFSWRELFMEAKVFHLPRICSDHMLVQVKWNELLDNP
ncbi:hypothetical protein PTKIN_Ptkin03bG0075100 [Pterospermum kingtungense]